MTVEFQYSPGEIRRLSTEHQRYIARRFGDRTVAAISWYLLLPAAFVASAVICDSLLVSIMVFAVLYGSSTIGNYWHRARFSKNYYSEKNFASRLLPTRIELLPDRLVLSNADQVHHHFWHSFHRFRETPSHFHLFFSPVFDIAVPKAAFPTEAERERFREQVRAHAPAKA